MSARLLPLAVLPALALAGCSKTVDEGSLEKRISERIAEGAFSQKPKVNCPGGKKAEKGTKFRCDGDLRGQRFKVEVTLLDEEKFTFRILQ